VEFRARSENALDLQQENRGDDENSAGDRESLEVLSGY
jgi:hypothetical protein